MKKDEVLKMWETECVSCGKMTPANKCPTLGSYDYEKRLWIGSMCKPCWLKENAIQS